MEPAVVPVPENKRIRSKVCTRTAIESVYQASGYSARDCVWRRDRNLDLAMTTAPPICTRPRSWPPRIMPSRRRAKARLPLPAGVRPFQLNWPYIIVIGAYHAAGAAGLHARLFQLERPHRGAARHASVRAVRHQPLLSPAAHPPRPEMSEMAGARDGRSSRCPACRKRRRAGSRSTAGTINSPTSSRTRTARWPVSSGATSAGSWSNQPELVAARHLPALRQGHPARPLLCRARAPQLAGLDQPRPDAAVLRRRFRRGMAVGRNAVGRGARPASAS